RGSKDRLFSGFGHGLQLRERRSGDRRREVAEKLAGKEEDASFEARGESPDMAPLQSITVRSPCGSCSCTILYHISNTHWNQHCVGRLRVAVEGKKGCRRVEEDPDLGNEKVKPRVRCSFRNTKRYPALGEEDLGFTQRFTFGKHFLN
ncbi:hypothetical protein GW17_00002112, partial [Ensete ventricosum]